LANDARTVMIMEFVDWYTPAEKDTLNMLAALEENYRYRGRYPRMWWDHRNGLINILFGRRP
jgi:hypothetical protein